jgi:hypothetical protein
MSYDFYIEYVNSILDDELYSEDWAFACFNSTVDALTIIE